MTTRTRCIISSVASATIDCCCLDRALCRSPELHAELQAADAAARRAAEAAGKLRDIYIGAAGWVPCFHPYDPRLLSCQ